MKRIIKTVLTLVLVFILFFGTWFITERLRAPEESLHTIYKKNITPCMNYWTTDPNFTDTNSHQAMAMRLYDAGEFALALEAFQQFEPAQEEEALYNLYIGICYLKSDFDNLAITHLLQSVELFTSFDRIQLSKWYLALAYLKAGMEKDATKILEEIVEVNAPQKSQAKAIIREIDYSSNPIKGLMMVFSD
ncbi:MAG: hypothetical protein Q8M15_11035 [Bacteroidota bacterium]|nr:hypothetical protein [Bacteroidota bacterium]